MKKIINGTRCAAAGSGGKTWLFMLAACVLAAGCRPVETAPAPWEGEVIEIRQGTTANFEGLRIGLSDISETEYAGSAGEKKRGLTAVLVLFMNGKPPREKRFDVRAGDTATLDKYSLYVQEVRGGSKGSILLRGKTTSQTPAP